jgi:transcription-repair coupling factor (superfamily II helicase)
MQEDHLEKVMVDFGEGRFDVLVCTAIIEAGLDIPNVNTIIINRANAFGLAQLYQLRGRVGRGANRAYAYFLHDNIYQLSETAERRLDVIRDATELGAGFRVAMRDLEIRGAGNLLGAEQHGHIAAVGFDLYTRLLADAVAELRELGGELGGDSEEPRAATRAAAPAFAAIDLPLDAFLPADYVAGDSERLALYQRMAGIRAETDLDALADELNDRFGPPPPAAESLLYLLRVKLRATAGKVVSVKVVDEAVVVRLGDEALLDRARVSAKLGTALRQTGPHTLRLDRAKLGGRWREALMQLLTLLTAPA